MSELTFTLSEQLKTLRERKGVTQEQMAADLKTTNVRISRIENGTGNPSLKFLEKICKYLDCHLSATPNPKQS